MTEGIPPGRVINDADARDLSRLLRAPRKWPRSSRAAEQRDELAAFQLIELHHKRPPTRSAPQQSSESIQIERSSSTASCHFGALRSDAGWPGNLTFLAVSVTWVPFILRIDMSLSRKFPI